MELKIKGVSCNFSFLFFAVLAIYLLLDQEGLGLPVLFAVVLHECGHLLMLYHFGGYLERVSFEPYGIRMEKRGLLSYGGEAAVYFGGAAANLCGVLLCLFIGRYGNFGRVNLLLAIFHMLPIGRLDGGVLLRLGLRCIGCADVTGWICGGIAFILLLPLFCAAAQMAVQGNYSLLFTAIYLLCAQLFAGESI